MPVLLRHLSRKSTVLPNAIFALFLVISLSAGALAAPQAGTTCVQNGVSFTRLQQAQGFFVIDLIRFPPCSRTLYKQISCFPGSIPRPTPSTSFSSTPIITSVTSTSPWPSPSSFPSQSRPPWQTHSDDQAATQTLRPAYIPIPQLTPEPVEQNTQPEDNLAGIGAGAWAAIGTVVVIVFGASGLLVRSRLAKGVTVLKRSSDDMKTSRQSPSWIAPLPAIPRHQRLDSFQSIDIDDISELLWDISRRSVIATPRRQSLHASVASLTAMLATPLSIPPVPPLPAPQPPERDSSAFPQPPRRTSSLAAHREDDNCNCNSPSRVSEGENFFNYLQRKCKGCGTSLKSKCSGRSLKSNDSTRSMSSDVAVVDEMLGMWADEGLLRAV